MTLAPLALTGLSAKGSWRQDLRAVAVVWLLLLPLAAGAGTTAALLRTFRVTVNDRPILVLTGPESSVPSMGFRAGAIGPVGALREASDPAELVAVTRTRIFRPWSPATVT